MGPSIQTQVQASDTGTLGAIAREESELKGAIFLARQFPRDEERARIAIDNACKRLTFAEDACYSFPRGGTTIKGPSIYLAREMARVWGNIRYGHRIVTETDDSVHIKGFAYDLETNTYVEIEDKFGKLIQRKNRGGGTDWLVPDERDLRELINRRAAICVRNALLQLMPSDMVELAVLRSSEMVAESSVDKQTIQKLAKAFVELLGSLEPVEFRLRHAIESITGQELADLRAIYNAIAKGGENPEDYFPTWKKPGAPPAKAEKLQGTAAAVAEEAKRRTDELKKGQEPAPATQPAPIPQNEPNLISGRIERVFEEEGTGRHRVQTVGGALYLADPEVWEKADGLVGKDCILTVKRVGRGFLLLAVDEDNGGEIEFPE